MRIPIVLALAAAAAAGCTAAGPAAAPTTSPTAVRTTAPAPVRTPPKPVPTPPPVTVDAPCPYADDETMAATVGQRIGRTTVTRTRPHVGCAYYRLNGERAADIRVSVLATAAAARTRALRLAGPAANPVDAGDGGAVAITDGGALLAVSEGRTLVVVAINQRISLEAVEVARLVLAKV